MFSSALALWWLAQPTRRDVSRTMNPFVRAAGSVPSETLERLGAELSDARTLPQVFAWLATQHPPLPAPEVVTHDEFTHDLVLPIDDHTVVVFEAT